MVNRRFALSLRRVTIAGALWAVKEQGVKVGRSASSTKMVNRLRFALSLRRVTIAGALWAVKEQGVKVGQSASSTKMVNRLRFALSPRRVTSAGALWASEGTKYEGRSASWGSRRLGRRLIVDD